MLNFSDKLAMSENYFTRNIKTWKLLYTKISRTTVLVQSWQLLYGWQNGVRQHYVTLPGSTASYGERTPTCTFENHSNLRANLTNWLLTGTVHSGEWLLKHYKAPRQPFSKLCSKFSALIVWINCQNRVPLKHGFVYYRLCHYVREHDDLPMLN